MDPTEFTCHTLAAELADEWVEYLQASNGGLGSARNYRRAIQRFCTYVEAHVPNPAEASLARHHPDLHLAATEFVRWLPTQFTAGSQNPANLAWHLQLLVGRRAQHPDREVAGHLAAWANGAVGLAKGRTQELDEFSRTEKKALIAAAWKDLLAIEARLAAGWRMAAAGRDPRIHGFDDPANLLWAVSTGAMTWPELHDTLENPRRWGSQLLDLIADRRSPQLTNARKVLMRRLLRQLFLHNLDLHSFRILLMAATGHTSEEITGLRDTDVEFSPDGVTLTLTKERAASVRQRPFASAEATEVLHPSSPRLDVADLLRRLMAAQARLAQNAQITSPYPLFQRTAIQSKALAIRRFDGQMHEAGFHTWLDLHGVRLSEPADIRRLRKSTKVEKTIAFKGRISDIADDHSVEVFQGHYAHGTTLRVIAGQVITKAQARWFEQALCGPTLLTGHALDQIEAGVVPDGLELDAAALDDLRSGQMDMGVCGCTNPYASPFARPGQLCPVAPLRCLECRYALVLPSNLPQLLLFGDHLEWLRARLSPPHFHELWGVRQANLIAALAEHSAEEIATARRHIAEDGVNLQLPLSAHVEFDT